MGLCSFSSELVFNNQTMLDNVFVNEFLPNASSDCVKVYLYGLYKCQSADKYDNTLESFAKVLRMSEEDIENCFLYWQDQGLVQVLSTRPIEVRYMPVKNSISKIKKYKLDKYESFNIQIQELIKGRMLTPNEYAEYYTLIESFNIEPEALIMCAQYCVKLKGDNVGYSYILSVAKNWAYENIKTAEAVEQKICEYEQQNTAIGEIFKVLAIKRVATVEERQLLNKWTNELDFNVDTIKYVAKSMKKYSKPNFEKLGEKLMTYYEMKLYTEKEISSFEKQKQIYFETAKAVCKSIGVYYESLDNVVETYISKWSSMGFDSDTLIKIANYGFKNSIRSLEGLSTIISKFYKLGLISSESIDQYMNELLIIDEEIKKLLVVLGLSRNVTTWDREYYKVWTEDWKMSKELIELSANESAGKLQATMNMNKLLSDWHEKNITNVEDAKKTITKTSETKSSQKKTKQNFTSREYKKEELNALFDSLDKLEEVDL